MKVNIVKILAVGSYRSFAYIKLNDDLTVCVRINRELYKYLREHDVNYLESVNL